MIYEAIAGLIDYAQRADLIGEQDRTWAINSVLQVLELDSWEEPSHTQEYSLNGALTEILDWAIKNSRVDNDITSRDLLDTKIMGCLTPRPSQVIRTFEQHDRKSPKAATDWFYQFSQNTNYIRRERIARDLKWRADSPYGSMDLTINLSKPEKDPRSIAAAKKAVSSGYPKCQLCRENEGYSGRIDHPARQNHRLIPLKLDGQSWFFQYSPYVYYNEHCIVFNEAHIPMRIDRSTFRKLLDFVRQFPHYFLGSNADLPIVGGSILSHDHFQGGCYTFPMERAPLEKELCFSGFPDVEAGIVRWPMSVVRLRSSDVNELVDLSDKILNNWRGYTDPSAFIFAETDGEAHNTITPIARMREGKFELDLVLRNNITTSEHPLGLYHPHQELHHIKKENIGLIEVMGLAVLPSRLKHELSALADALVNSRDIRSDELLKKHADWAETLRKQYVFTDGNVNDILRKEVGAVFVRVLEHAGVYKCTSEGRAAFLRFINSVNE